MEFLSFSLVMGYLLGFAACAITLVNRGWEADAALLRSLAWPYWLVVKLIKKFKE